MLYKLGRFLQLVGMIMLPIAIAGNAVGQESVSQMLMWTCAGIGVFMLGRTIQGKGEP